MAKFEHTKFGLKHDPRGAHVTLTVKDQTLIGTVRDVQYNEVIGAIELTVHHLNGEPWPLRPTSRAVDVLER